MAYYRTSLYNPDIVNVENEQIIENEISLGRWLIDAIGLLSSINESYKLDKLIEIKDYGISYIPTIYLEKGCKALQIEGKTIIDIRSNLLYETEIRESTIYNYLINNKLIDKLIIVYIKGNKSHETDSPRSKIILKKANIFIDEIKSAIKQNKGDILPIIKSKPKEWTSVREIRIQNAINDIKRYNSTFFLGAGVSVSANIPKWDELLKNLLLCKDCYCMNEYDEVTKEMGFSNLITARYIAKAANLDKQTIVNSIRDLLYTKSGKESQLITTICSLIQKLGKVQSIITYNYDTLIEENLNKKEIKNYSVYKYNRSDNSVLPVYHVHGIIFRKNSENVPENIVLSEEDYHEKYSQVFDWSNVEQLHALTRNTCLFIGLSMKDPNLRRLLEIAKKGYGKALRHYVFLERDSFYENKEKSEQDFLTRENILADLGLNVIWYEGNNNHKELPTLIERIQKEISSQE